MFHLEAEKETMFQISIEFVDTKNCSAVQIFTVSKHFKLWATDFWPLFRPNSCRELSIWDLCITLSAKRNDLIGNSYLGGADFLELIGTFSSVSKVTKEESFYQFSELGDNQCLIAINWFELTKSEASEQKRNFHFFT